MEDDHAVCSLASEALLTSGLSVVETGSGLAAVRFLEEGDIAIVVTDIGMPGAGGFEVARAAGSASPGVPIQAIRTDWT